MEILTTIMLVVYGCAILFILLHSLGLASLYYQYRKHKWSDIGLNEKPEIADQELPLVTVQLPVYNEKYVVGRLIDVVADFDYPKDRFDIQILDDSTDETSDIIAAKVKELTDRGYQVSHVQRDNREGYKAGALKFATEFAAGDLIAIFDADFIPQRDFLKRTVPFFANEKLALVQSRWTHLNADYSLLTRLLGFALDFHFSVEQVGRNSAGHLMNFNGTAGVWRKTAIADAGGWQSDTLTEDLDLSYRAQLRGWELNFKEEIAAPAELPVTMGAIKSQQFRWMKGGAENARKNLQRVFLSDLSPGTKYHATVHLLGCLLPVCISYIVFSSALMLFYFGDQFSSTGYSRLTSILPVVSIFYIFSYWTAYSRDHVGSKLSLFVRCIGTFVGFAAVFMSLSLILARASLEGIAGIKSPFVRTPKLNIVRNSDKWFDKLDYASFALSPMIVLEALGTCILLATTVFALTLSNYSVMLFFALPTTGFLILMYYNISHRTV